MKRITSLLILTAILFCLTACGGNRSSPDPEETATAAENTVATESETLYADALPEDLNLSGKKVVFLYREEKLNEFFTDNLTGDVVNDALFNSMSAVEQRLNAVIETVALEGHLNPARGEYMNHITATVMAGDKLYDWVDLMIGNSPVKMSEGIFLNLTGNKYIDFDSPWYLDGMSEELAVDGKLYFISGDASLGYMKCAFCLYFNSDLAADTR